MQELKTDFASICISPKPSGTPMGKVPMQVVKEFEHQARQNLCTLNFSAAFNQVISECNLVMESCRDSLKATSKRVKTQIQKGANPERVAKNGYERTCDYLDILDRWINIQQKALACQSKALSHMLQRELYTMGYSVLIKREGEMSHLQPHLGDTRCQQLRSSPFAPTPLFHFQLVKDGKEFLLKKGTPQNTQGFKPYQNQPFRGPLHNRKEAPTGNSPMGDNPQAVTSYFPPKGGIPTTEVARVVFDPTTGAEGMVTLPPNDYSTSTNPPVGGHLSLFRRDWLKEKS